MTIRDNILLNRLKFLLNSPIRYYGGNYGKAKRIANKDA